MGYQEEHVLFKARNHLRFGPLDYIFEYNTESEADFLRTRMEYVRKYLCHTADADDSSAFDPMRPFLDPLPKPTQVPLGEMIVHQTVTRGAFGIVRVGVHKRSGKVVACKTIHCRTLDIPSVRGEMILASQGKRRHLLVSSPASLHFLRKFLSQVDTDTS